MHLAAFCQVPKVLGVTEDCYWTIRGLKGRRLRHAGPRTGVKVEVLHNSQGASERFSLLQRGSRWNHNCSKTAKCLHYFRQSEWPLLTLCRGLFWITKCAHRCFLGETRHTGGITHPSDAWIKHCTLKCRFAAAFARAQNVA